MKRSILTAFAIMLATLPARAQVDAQSISGPIDIQANEQEFSGDQVIARGNVRVTYKDSVILAPQATLVRDAGGNPQKAVFSGRPRLTQGANKIDADTLIFEIANQKIIAEGSAHSEVTGNPGSGSGGAEKIITDSDRQEYDKATDKFEATGNVKVTHGDIVVKANKLQLVYGSNRKPETAVFSGNVLATQNQNATQADTITYNLATKRLQATGHVKSKVIQKKADGSKKGGAAALPGSPNKALNLSGGETNPLPSGSPEEPLLIISDSQDYSQDTGRLTAEGNVKVMYQDTVGIGPRVILLRNAEGKAERVLFTGRSQVSQPGKRWLADRITVTVADKRVLAEGNTKAYILQMPKKQGAPGQEGRIAASAPGGEAISANKIEIPQ